jgi:hypothetical protein
MRKLAFIFMIFSLIACKKEDVKIPLKIENIQVIDMGHLQEKYAFTASFKNDSVCACTLRTIYIKVGDTLESMDAWVKGDLLTIDVNSLPYDFDCNVDSCFTIHDVKFDLKGLEHRSYTVDIGVNGSHMQKLNCDLE